MSLGCESRQPRGDGEGRCCTGSSERPNDRIGLVAFGPRLHRLSRRSTTDHDFLERRTTVLQTRMIEDGTAIGSALRHGGEPAKRVEVKEQDRDPHGRRGINNAGKIPLTAAEAARPFGVKVIPSASANARRGSGGNDFLAAWFFNFGGY